MCKAFSCIATRRKVYWQLGIDSHEDLKDKFKLKDTDKNKLIPIEISPKNNNYIDPDEWVFKFDDETHPPDWWKLSNEKMCFEVHKVWLKELNGKLYKNRIRNLIHPLKLPMVNQVNKSQIRLLKQWDSVWDSVGLQCGLQWGLQCGIQCGIQCGLQCGLTLVQCSR